MLSDDSVHSDIESQMFKYSDQAPEAAQKLAKEVIENPESQSSFFVELVLKRTRHFKYNVAMAFLSGLKILATVAIIFQTPKSCPDVLNYWLIAMSCYDFINVVSRFMLIKLLIPKRKNRGPSTEQIPSEKESGLNTSTTSQGKQILIGEIDAMVLLQEKKEDKAVQAVAVTRFIYIGLFVWGQVILYRYLRGGCNELLNMRTALFYVFVAFGYIYIGVPLLIFILDCICTGFRELKEWIKEKLETRRKRAVSTTEKIIIYRKYTMNLTGAHKCGICLDGYKYDDNLIQLQCNINHHFHERCLTSWMENDNKCPLCNQKIAYNKDNSQFTTEISPRSSVASIFS